MQRPPDAEQGHDAHDAATPAEPATATRPKLKRQIPPQQSPLVSRGGEKSPIEPARRASDRILPISPRTVTQMGSISGNIIGTPWPSGQPHDRMMKEDGQMSPGQGGSGFRLHLGRKGVAATANTPADQVNSPADSFRSPLATNMTRSTESTESSSKTIRGSAAATPAGEIHTPSYPFPFIPGTPRTWSSTFHQPFTTLSPTSLPQRVHSITNPDPTAWSDVTSPAPSFMTFIPNKAENQEGVEQFAPPNLYELTLKLNSEPGLDAWWTAFADILIHHFAIERATLTVPADNTDIENVPWGQKATFNVHGTAEEREGQKQPELEVKVNQWSQTVSPNRPDLDTELSPTQITPRGLRSFGSFSFSNDPNSPHVWPRPHNAMFPSLKPLEVEPDPLLDASGVLRLLDRGKMVMLTREYSTNNDEAKSSSSGATSKVKTSAPPKPELASEPTDKPLQNKPRLGLFARAPKFAGGRRLPYEEYEQFPESPWAQSPAPSPAIQNDPNDNPFFQSNTNNSIVDESSFSPDGSTHDYSKCDKIEAIGVDRASTVLHIPLVHPILSRTMQTIPRGDTSQMHPDFTDLNDPHAHAAASERRAPIAIISLLSPIVPYPQPLAYSLKYLAAHLATSYSNAQQYSNIHNSMTALHHRRQSSRQVGFAPEASEVLALQHFDNRFDVEGLAASLTGSMTSPSEYSARSKQSPSASSLGTPAWDPSAVGFTRPRSSANTPSNNLIVEASDSYFDAHKGHSPSRPYSHSSTSHNLSPVTKQVKNRKSDTITPILDESPSESAKEMRSATKKQFDNKRRSFIRARSESKIHTLTEQDKKKLAAGTPLLNSRLQEEVAESPSYEEADKLKAHSKLHSYGAETSGHLHRLSAAGALPPGGTGLSRHTRSRSAPDDPEMLPPSERLMRLIIDALPVQIFTAAPNTGNLTWVNQKFLVYRGHDPHQVMEEPWQPVHPDDKQKFMTVWQRALRTGQQVQEKLRLKRFDGNFRWFYLRAAPLYDKRQSIVHWMGTMMDVHEQHLAEVNLARQQETNASEAKYRALANSSPQIMFAATRSKGVSFCNTQWLTYSGQNEPLALGVGFMDYVHPDDMLKCKLPMFDETSDEATNVPTTVRHEPSRTSSGFSNDHTDPSSSNSSAGTEKGQQPSVTSPIVTLPPAQRRLSLLASTGFLSASKDVDGRPFYSTEVRLRNKDGEYRWHLIHIVQAQDIGDTNGEETWYGTCTDINAHKTLEYDMKESMDAKTRFLSNMSHEIRTPLNGITGMVNFLIDSNLTSEQMEHVNIIRASTEGLRDLINDILDLSKVEAGAIKLVSEWFDLRGLIEDVNDLTSTLAIDKGLELNYLVEEDVPMVVKGDRFRIRQVLLNVVGNAIKFTDRGEVFIHCRVHQDQLNNLEPHEAFVLIDIVDTGSGFTQKEAEALFKRFSQIDGSSTRQHGGTGLGLVISKQLVELHGGEMTARGEPGKGSTFSFFVKLEVPSDKEQPDALDAAFRNLDLPQTPYSSIKDSPRLLPTTSSGSGSNVPTTSLASSGLQDERPSPTTTSSASSDPSLGTSRTMSLRSEQSLASSVISDRLASSGVLKPEPHALPQTPSQMIYSVLVICPLRFAREATVRHIEMIMPRSATRRIFAHETVKDFHKLRSVLNLNTFTHVVLILKEASEILEVVDSIFDTSGSESRRSDRTVLLIITDLAQKRKIVADAQREQQLSAFEKEHRLVWIFRPLKPSKIANIFDPGRERVTGSDHAHESAQQVALTQKQVYEDLTRRLDGKGIRVLLVEDNHINQMVLMKFLRRINVDVDTVSDGVQCTNMLFDKPHDTFSIILCDLHMPNKDGYQTCKEIRQWETLNHFPHMPVIALSANVLGDVYAKCVEAGFNSYITKPVDFKDLHKVLTKFLDPEDPKRPHDFMKPAKEQHGRAGSRTRTRMK